MSPARARVVILAAVAIEVAAAAVLVPQATSSPIPVDHLPTWVETAGAVEVLVALATWAGAGVALWLLAVTTCSVLAASGRDAARRLATRVVPRPLVRLCAVAMSPAMVLGPAAAAAIEAPIPPPAEAPTADDDPTGEIPAPEETPTIAPSPGVDDLPTPWRGVDDLPTPTPDQPPTRETSPDEADASPTEPGEVTVVAGDNLWVMTARHLAAARGVNVCALSDAEIAEVWRVVVRENRPLLRSGDPDLIFPGESVLLPTA